MQSDEVVSVIVRRARMIASLCLFAVVSAIAFTYLIPDKYLANALVLVRPEEAIVLTPLKPVTKEILNLPASGNMQVETPSKTYIEVIKSRAVAEKVVRILNLDKRPVAEPSGSPYRNAWKRLQQAATRALDAAFDIAQYGRVVSRDPFERAVQRLMKGLSLSAIRSTYVFEIAYEATDPQEAAAVANTAATMFVELNSTANELEAKTVREFIEAQLRKAEQELADARQALLESKGQLKSVSFAEERTAQLKTLSDLDASLAKTEVQLSGLLKRLTPSNPKVLALRGEREHLVEDIARRKSALERLPAEEAQLAMLELNVKMAESTYEGLKREYDEARIRESRLTREIRVVSPAAVPAVPIKPIKIYYAGAAFFVALMTGVGLAFLLSVMNTKLRTVRDVEQVLDLPVLATIPTAHDKAR